MLNTAQGVDVKKNKELKKGAGNLVYNFLYSKFSIVLLLFIINVLFVNKIFASEILFETKNRDVGIGQQFEVFLLLDTEGLDINALEGNIVFPGTLLELIGIRNGSSIISHWIESPQVTPENVIRFSGVIQRGYSGGSGLIFSIVFRGKQEAIGEVKAFGLKVLQNDGQGTDTDVKTKNFKVNIFNSEETIMPDTQLDVMSDSDPPELLNLKIVQDKNVFDGKYFLVLIGQDKGSGIDHYEVREGFWGEFVRVENPHLLQNQNLDKKIYIKVIDRVGNEQIEILRPQNYKKWNYYYLATSILIVIIFILSSFIIRKKYG